VVQTVAIVGVVAGVAGLCMFNMGRGISMVGPVAAAGTPLTAAFGGVFVEDALTGTLNGAGVQVTRVALFIGAMLWAGVYIAIVYGLRASMVHNFDMTVRRLAGTA
jgi:hypothetical protein